MGHPLNLLGLVRKKLQRLITLVNAAEKLVLNFIRDFI